MMLGSAVVTYFCYDLINININLTWVKGLNPKNYLKQLLDDVECF